MTINGSIQEWGIFPGEHFTNCRGKVCAERDIIDISKILSDKGRFYILFIIIITDIVFIHCVAMTVKREHGTYIQIHMSSSHPLTDITVMC